MDLAPELQQIIDEEERILAEVLSSLHGQHRIGTDQFRSNSRDARSLTSQIVAATRAEDKQQLASDEAVAHGLSKLRKGQVESIKHLLENPYFARIIVEEPDARGNPKEIEYKIGTRANVDCRIIDWRAAPISKLYYEYKEGEEYCEYIQGKERLGRVRLRRRVEIKDGILERISTPSGDLIKTDGSWTLSSASNRKRSRGALPDVLSLITKEQFKTITEDAETAVLIQGVAGSGKTTVALYRLAWLLSQPQETALRSVIVVRSPLLRNYIRAALPKIGLENLSVMTYRDWLDHCGLKPLISEVLPPEKLVGGVQRLKQSMAVLNVLEEYVEGQTSRLLALLDELLSSLSGEKIQPLQTVRNLIATKKLALIPAMKQILEIGWTGEWFEKLQKTARRLELYREDLARIFQMSDEILSHDDTQLLDRDIIRTVRDFTEQNLLQGIVDEFDLPLLFRLYSLKQGGVTLEGSSASRFDYLVADEVQDFSPVEIATMIGSVRSLEGLTLVGDEAQAVTHENAFPGWEKLRTRWNLGRSLSRFVSLQVSFRSTGPIMRLADHVLGEHRSHGGRPGARPMLLKCSNEEQAIRELASHLSTALERSGGDLIAVLCANRSETRYVHSLLEPSLGATVRLGDDDSFDFEEGVIVAEIAKVKGLEFASVVLWNPNRHSYPNTPLSRRMLYVAITRAEEQVAVVAWDNMTNLLPSDHSSLYDLVEPEVGEEGSEAKDGEELFDPYPRFE